MEVGIPQQLVFRFFFPCRFWRPPTTDRPCPRVPPPLPACSPACLGGDTGGWLEVGRRRVLVLHTASFAHKNIVVSRLLIAVHDDGIKVFVPGSRFELTRPTNNLLRHLALGF